MTATSQTEAGDVQAGVVQDNRFLNHGVLDNRVLDNQEQPSLWNSAGQLDIGMSGAVGSDFSTENRQSLLTHLNRLLITPLNDLGSRPSKHIRRRLVRVGFASNWSGLVAKESDLELSKCERLGDIVELLHLGSLVVDDIQDGSLERRGGPSLHLSYGVPGSLCAGNWLYFHAMKLLGLAGLSSEAYQLGLEHFIQTLQYSHYGQALDLGIKARDLGEQDLRELPIKVAQLKTGALMGLALQLGGLARWDDDSRDAASTGTSRTDSARIDSVRIDSARIDSVRIDSVRRWITELGQLGRELGGALQCFDDLGNLTTKHSKSKIYEDLQDDKPTTVWSQAVRVLNETDRETLRLLAARLPDSRNELTQFLSAKNFLANAKALVDQDFNAAKERFACLTVGCGNELAKRLLTELGDLLTGSYL